MEKNTLTIPIAIILAGVLIGGAVILSNKNSTSVVENPLVKEKQAIEINIKPIDSSDHIVGNPNAEVMLVEYSDTECPFCKRFHDTLNRFVDEYGKDGKFTWVYRHFPLDGLHKKARKEAEATECAADLGGNAKFWEYINALYAKTTSNDGLDPAELPKIAVQVGLDKTAFETCLNSGKFAGEVDNDYKEAVKIGGRGTPYSIFILNKAPSKELKEFIAFNNAEILKMQQPGSSDIMGLSKDERKIFVSGAMPYEMMKSIIDLILK
ncbi:MAG: DsbA family protein [Candidatus Paceibacterota bacterium]